MGKGDECHLVEGKIADVLSLKGKGDRVSRLSVVLGRCGRCSLRGGRKVKVVALITTCLSGIVVIKPLE